MGTFYRGTLIPCVDGLRVETLYLKQFNGHRFDRGVCSLLENDLISRFTFFLKIFKNRVSSLFFLFQESIRHWDVNWSEKRLSIICIRVI